MSPKKTSEQKTSLVSLYFLHWTAHLLQRKIKPRKDIFSSMKLLRILKVRPFSFIPSPHCTTVHMTKIGTPTNLSKITIQHSGQVCCHWMKVCSRPEFCRIVVESTNCTWRPGVTQRVKVFKRIKDYLGNLKSRSPLIH